MHSVLRCPAVPEERGWNAHAADGEHGQPELGLGDVAVPARQGAVDAVHAEENGDGAEQVADAGGDEVEGGDGFGFVVGLFPQGREGGENEVGEAVDVRRVERQTLDDGFGGEKVQGADEGLVVEVDDGWVVVLVRGPEDPFMAFTLLHQAVLPPVEEDRPVGFSVDAQCHEDQGPRGTGRRVEAIPPRGRELRDKGTDDGTARGCKDVGHVHDS